MLEWIVSSSALILAVALLRRLLRGKIGPRLQYALWLIVLARLLVPVSFGSAGVSVQNLVREADEKAAAQVVTYVNQTPPSLSPETPAPAQSAQAQPQSTQSPAAAPTPQPEATPTETARPVTLTDILRCVWYAGMAAMALWFLCTNLRFRARLRRDRRRAEYACKLPVYVTGAVETPCLFGVLRPAVYLTPEAASEPETLRHSVEHELTHSRHGDHIWALLRCLCLVLHWYNPLVWLAAALSRRDAELACDEATIARLGENERAAYGRTLIRVSCERRPTLLRTATTMNFSKSALRERITQIARRPQTAAYALVILIIAAVALTSCTFTGAKPGEPELEGFIAENSGLETGEGQYLAASYDLLSEEDGTYYVNCCIAVFELYEDRTLNMACEILTPMSLTLKHSGGSWEQESFWAPEDWSYNYAELEQRFPPEALERLEELSERGSLHLVMRCSEQAVEALDADVGAAIEPYLRELEELGAAPEDAPADYAAMAFYGNCAVEYMRAQLEQPDLSDARRLVLNEAVAYIEARRDPDGAWPGDAYSATPSDIANSPQAEYTPETWPEFVAVPAEGGYEFSSEELGFSFTVPEEISQKVAVASGVDYFDPVGTSLTLYYVPENGRYPITMFYLVAESPRGDFFRPGSWYYDSMTSYHIEAMSETAVYFTMGQLGGSEIGRDDPLWDDFIETSEAVSAAISAGIAVDETSSVPALDYTAVLAAVGELTPRGDAALTRAEAAELAYGLLSAENKAKAYPLDYTDVQPGSEAAQAIAYLASYGLLTRYSKEGEDLDGGLFRPGEYISRAEFVTLLHRLSFKPYPLAYGDALDCIGLDHWAFVYVDYAWKCGWLELTDGDIRADEPITCAEAARALICVAAYGYPTPSIENAQQPPVKVLPATDELLEGYGELPEYGDSTAEYARRILLLPEQTLSGFKFVRIEPSYTEFNVTDVICETETLTPDTPILLWATFPGDAPQFGLTFTDPSQTEWRLALAENWATGGFALSNMGDIQP